MAHSEIHATNFVWADEALFVLPGLVGALAGLLDGAGAGALNALAGLVSASAGLSDGAFAGLTGGADASAFFSSSALRVI